ncbi:hypothetical protein ACRALDRAFT_1063363 [Sodiomyces alcalophilus JCM 7366]|uniref:uncharacterized protein n=1 Tax=Sodiomyces alcalophilus JCM 7366 TaxID=591952 RepID=UPI0039B509FE
MPRRSKSRRKSHRPSPGHTIANTLTPSAKQHAIDQGGKIGHEYSLIKGFSVTFDKDSVMTLQNHEHVDAVEADQEVKTC